MKKEKIQCILCPYRKEENCMDKHEKCYSLSYSLSNIYYGTLINLFPFKQIYNLSSELSYRKENKYCEKMDKKYGDYALETDDYKFIWGITNQDDYDLSSRDANMYTMNDIDIVYDKKSKKYLLGIETAYSFRNYAAECRYLRKYLDAFTQYMNDQHLNTKEHFMLFMHSPCTAMEADSIEELYTNFKIFVDGYCDQSEVKI